VKIEHLVSAALLAFALSVAPAAAHGPTPIKVDEKITVPADPKTVWAIVGRFGSLAEWHPDVASVKASGGDAIGATRDVTLRKGGVLQESLDDYDPKELKYSYRMSDPNLDALPVSSYSATIAVRPAAGGGSEVEWYGRLYRGDTSNDPPENLNDDAARTAMSDFLRAGLDGLAKKLQAK
jgi:mxaD protein